MANYTPNFNLMKPLGSENYNVSQQNGNMDKIDSALQGLGNGLGIIAKGNTHAAITSGEYVYVHGHGTLAEGLYKATANIAANGTLTSSNLAALPKGVGVDVAALNSNITSILTATTFSTVYNGLTWNAIQMGNILIISAISGSTTEAILAGNAFISLTDLSSDFTGKSFYIDEQFTIATNTSMRCVLRKNGNELLAYGENGGQIPSGTSIRVTIVCAIK